MTRVSLERIADTLFPQPQKGNSTAYGTVESINPDGSYQVKMNASATTTRCAKLCDAEVSDRVLVLIQANGHCAAIGRVGGSKGTVTLYDNASGTGGTVTLSESAANFEHMRIYFKKNGDSGTYSSVDVYSPNGKTVALLVYNPFSTSRAQIVARAVTISGTTISKYSGHGSNAESYWNFGETGGNTSTPSVYITRVEAW